jgi:hypothetical protein
MTNIDYKSNKFINTGRSASLHLTNISAVAHLFKNQDGEPKMDIVVDTSALIAVIVNEPEKNKGQLLK